MATHTLPLVSLRGPLRRGPALISPAADAALLLLSPLAALVVTAGLVRVPGAVAELDLGALRVQPLEFGLSTLIAAHLALTFVRSHGNPALFRRHPWRFTAAPLVLFGALLLSDRLRALAAVVAVLWDVHHSALQTFGLGRLFDRLDGVDAERYRRADLWLNHLLYTGPILAGLGLLHHVNSFHALDRVGLSSLAGSAALARELRPWLTVAVLALGLPALAAYGAAVRTVARGGGGFPVRKLVLLATTGVVSFASWGLDSFGQALLTMKLFHCVQYATLVLWSERARRSRAAMVFAIALALVWGFGAALARAVPDPGPMAASVLLAVTLVHFWYDGFIWSVRRGDL